ncbi:patatin-like phospholipase family protein [Arenibacter algicola]|uniref:patatin-like phospholipase family protein n=1 Tax=Arenibacter algicola TaxID=616991 RepID=UPI001C0651A6|nr:patatin-like phospholipase family protein [Arenibacter algicola]MBU2907227.1 patatin-like phospholipase family protein [Arenibacter algicola]
MKLQELKGKTIGLVLSGGGLKGMAHIGIIKALNERDIYPDIMSGVSAGAIVGALYANGTNPMNMLDFFKETPLFKYNLFSINKPGLFDTEKYYLFFSKYFDKDTFDVLEKELFVTATDLQSGVPKVFSSGELIRPLLASAALPPVFNPVTIDGRLYADGGIMNNFPLEPLANKVDYIIGCYTSGMQEIAKSVLKSPLQLANRINRLMLHANSREKLCATDILFRPKDLEYIKVLDKKGIDKAYMIGYDHASRYLDSLLDL